MILNIFKYIDIDKAQSPAELRSVSMVAAIRFLAVCKKNGCSLTKKLLNSIKKINFRYLRPCHYSKPSWYDNKLII